MGCISSSSLRAVDVTIDMESIYTYSLNTSSTFINKTEMTIASVSLNSDIIKKFIKPISNPPAPRLVPFQSGDANPQEVYYSLQVVHCCNHALSSAHHLLIHHRWTLVTGYTRKSPVLQILQNASSLHTAGSQPTQLSRCSYLPIALPQKCRSTGPTLLSRHGHLLIALALNCRNLHSCSCLCLLCPFLPPTPCWLYDHFVDCSESMHKTSHQKQTI